MITDRCACERRGSSLAAAAGAAADAGAPAILFREKDLPPADRRALAREVAASIRPAGARLIVASDPLLAAELETEWLHLAAADAPIADPQLHTGRSCHGAAELLRAAAEGCAYATISPVHPSASKPGHGPALGAGGLARLAEMPGLPPLYALGGVTSATAPGCLAAGARGVAVMGAVMAAADPAAATRKLLLALRISAS